MDEIQFICKFYTNQGEITLDWAGQADNLDALVLGLKTMMLARHENVVRITFDIALKEAV